MGSRPGLKTLIVGLDGATFDLILPFVKENRLPTFARLLEKGAWGELESTIPPITAAAWTSFMTGENPGKHGTIDFIKIIGPGPDGNAQHVVTTEDFAGRTFFDVMAGNGLKVGVMTVPVTFPPWDVNGIMISGYPCPDNDKIYSTAKDISFRVDEPLNFGAEYYRNASEDEIIEDCLHRDRLRKDLMFDLLEKHEFDCFAVVLGGIDRAQHDYWKYHDPDYPFVDEDKREKFRDAIYRNYKLADDVLAQVLERYGDAVNLFILSDHGAGRHPFVSFNVNLWLRRNGLLEVRILKALSREAAKGILYALYAALAPRNRKSSRVVPKITPRSPADGGGSGRVFDWKRTRAFFYPLMYPTGGIMINLEGRQPHGTVRPGKEYEALVDEIIEKLSSYRDAKTGEKVVEKAVRRGNLYHGRYVEDFPDIVYVLNRKYESEKNLFGPVTTPVRRIVLEKKSGLHLMHGIFMAHGPDVAPGKIGGARIIDLAPTLLYNIGLPVPESMDGVVLKEIFREDMLRLRPVRYAKWEGAESGNGHDVETEENEQMKDKLRSLGYL
jgi:predicted AlkP superfamily phosphohydrolase/phosphomutase